MLWRKLLAMAAAASLLLPPGPAASGAAGERPELGWRLAEVQRASVGRGIDEALAVAHGLGLQTRPGEATVRTD